MPHVTIEISSALEDKDVTDALIEAIRQADAADMVLIQKQEPMPQEEKKLPVVFMTTLWRRFRGML